MVSDAILLPVNLKVNSNIFINKKSMKKVSFILAVLSILVSSAVSGQTKSGFDYFKGKWNVLAQGPTGDVKMVVAFELLNGKVTSTIKDSEGKDMFKVVNTSVNEKRATISFIGSQGEVDMILVRKDDDHLTGDIMSGIAYVTGERVKENK